MLAMHPSMRRVLVVRVRAIFREARNKLGTPGGILVALLLLGTLIGPFVARAVFPGLGASESIGRWGTTGVLGLWFVQVLLRGTGDVLGFEPAEADQLFAAPVPQEQLMRYKVGLLLIAWANTAVLLTPIASMYAGSVLGGFFAALLVMPFLQMSAMILTLIREGAGIPSGLRYGVIVVLIGLPTVMSGGIGQGADAVADGVNAVAAHPVGMVLIAPFVASATMMGATTIGPVLASAATLAVIDAALVMVLLRLGQRAWVETAQAGADVLRSRMQSLRSDGLAGASGWIRLLVPRLRILGGFGGVFWRRTVELVRRPATWVGFGGVIALLITVGLVVGRDRSAVDALLVAGLVWSTVMLPSVLRSDFRSDLDRMDALRAMPVGTAALFLGNTLPMGLMIGAFEALLALALVMYQPDAAFEGVAAVLLAPLWTVVVVLAENTIFLFLPARMEAGEAALGSVGRNLLSTLLGWVTHGTAASLAVVLLFAFGMLIGFWAGVLAAWITLFVCGVVMAVVGTMKLARFTPPIT